MAEDEGGGGGMMLHVQALTFNKTRRRQKSTENLKSSQKALFFLFSSFIFPLTPPFKNSPESVSPSQLILFLFFISLFYLSLFYTFA